MNQSCSINPYGHLVKKAKQNGGVAPGMPTADHVEVKKDTILKQRKESFLKNVLSKQPVSSLSKITESTSCL